jgi:translation initiation factor 3 subunit K
MTQFPSAQFNLAMHLINPSAAGSGELHEAIGKLRALNGMLEGAQYSRFWAMVEGDDLVADLITDITGFEDIIRERIAGLISEAFREVSVTQLEGWLGLSEGAARKFVSEECGWAVEGTKAIIPKNADNEAKKAEIREDVNVEMFSRVIRRSWEETV